MFGHSTTWALTFTLSLSSVTFVKTLAKVSTSVGCWSGSSSKTAHISERSSSLNCKWEMDIRDQIWHTLWDCSRPQKRLFLVQNNFLKFYPFQLCFFFFTSSVSSALPSTLNSLLMEFLSWFLSSFIQEYWMVFL